MVTLAAKAGPRKAGRFGGSVSNRRKAPAPRPFLSRDSVNNNPYFVVSPHHTFLTITTRRHFDLLSFCFCHYKPTVTLNQRHGHGHARPPPIPPSDPAQLKRSRYAAESYLACSTKSNSTHTKGFHCSFP